MHDIAASEDRICAVSPSRRHLDYFEMLRNDDELALAKRFESVSQGGGGG